jgi:hypothetical protein
MDAVFLIFRRSGHCQHWPEANGETEDDYPQHDGAPYPGGSVVSGILYSVVSAGGNVNYGR